VLRFVEDPLTEGSNFGGEDLTTGILSTTNFPNDTNSDNAWYDLSGRKLGTQPTAKGVYIYKGKKRVIK
jgi:alpha-amylase